MIRFWYGSGSPFSWRVQLVLEEKRLPYEPILLSFAKGEHKTPEHLARSPHGKVPALADDGVTLYESSAIVEYLEERYPDPPLLPRAPADRARVRIEELECLNYFAERFLAAARLVFFTPRERRDPAAIEAARRRALTAWTIVDEAVADQPYLAGAELSLAEIVLGTQIYRWFSFPIERPVLPNLKAWYDRLHDRPGFKTHIEVPIT